MSVKYVSDKIRVLKGDITKQNTDAIVNAANSSLLGGGGVDGAIHSSGGSRILDECRAIISKIGKLETGKAVITSGGNLKAKYVIHTVGPVWRGGDDDEEILLSNCYANSLKLAAKEGISTISFPNISTGVYGYPKDLAANVAYFTVKASLDKYESISEVIFVCFDDYNYELYMKLLDKDKRDKIKSLIDFIPYFENDKINMSYSGYDTGITDFIDLVYETDLLKEDYMDYLESKGIQDTDSKEIIDIIKGSDMLLLRSILTYFVRQERFYDGLWVKASKDKIFLNILYRLKEL
jgi:O-acetyl-ADP-ribose deacetylase